DVPHTQFAVEQGFDPSQLHILDLLHRPHCDAVAGLQLGFKWLRGIAVDTARLFQVNLETRAFGGVVILRATQADRCIQHVLASTWAALLPAFAGVMYNEDRNSAATQL